MTDQSKTNIVRTHDEFYLNLDRKNSPKEYFKFIIEQLVLEELSLNDKSILDIGCATGDFLYYLRSKYHNANLNGLEILPALAQKASIEVPGALIEVGDISAKSFEVKKKYDFIFMLGVHSIFDDLLWLDNIKLMMGENSHFFCFGLFNSFDIDVFIKARNFGQQSLESGWNIFSISSIKEKLDAISMNSKFTPWSIDIQIPQVKNDPFRSWTVPLETGKLEIRNGLQINHTFYLLHATRK